MAEPHRPNYTVLSMNYKFGSSHIRPPESVYGRLDQKQAATAAVKPAPQPVAKGAKAGGVRAAMKAILANLFEEEEPLPPVSRSGGWAKEQPYNEKYWRTPEVA